MSKNKPKVENGVKADNPKKVIVRKSNLPKQNDVVMTDDEVRDDLREPTLRDLSSYMKDFLKIFKEPLAWFFIMMSLIFAVKGMELIGSMRGHKPIFYFLSGLFKDLGGIFAEPQSHFRYLRRIPAIFYQMVIPFIIIWLAASFKRNITVSSGYSKHVTILKILKSSFSRMATRFGLSLKCLRYWWKPIALIFAIMLPFMFFFGTSNTFKRSYPYLTQLRQSRSRMEIVDKRIELREKSLKQLNRGAYAQSGGAQSRKNRIDNQNAIDSKKSSTIFWAAIWMFLLFEFIRIFYMFSWEFLFRGFMLNALRPKFGYYAIFVQMIPYVILHSTKPGIELFYTIPGGLLLGLLAYKTRSIWPGFILHAGGAVLFDVFAMFF